MSNIPPTFSRNSECLSRKCEDQFSQRVHPVTLIEPDLTEDQKCTHILYHNSYTSQNIPNHYDVDPNKYKIHYSSDQLSQFVDQDNFICNNYVHPGVQVGEAHCKNNDYRQNPLYPIHNTYMNYLLNNCEETPVSHMSNQHSFFTSPNLPATASQHCNNVPFTKLSEKPVASESDVLLNSFVGNLTPSGFGMYSQFGETTNSSNSFTSSNLINTFDQAKPEPSPIKKMEKKQTKLLYSDVLNRAVSNEKIQPVSVKGNNVSVKGKLERAKTKKLERRKSCPCVNNSPEHTAHQSVNSNTGAKEFVTKESKTTLKDDSSVSDQDETNTNVQNTPKTKATVKINSAQKSQGREPNSKDNVNSSTNNSVTENSPRKHYETNANTEKFKSVGKKSNKQNRFSKQDKNISYTNKKSKSRKKKKYFGFEEYLSNWQQVLKKIGFWFWTLLWDITMMSSNLAIDFFLNMYTVSRQKIQYVRSEVEFKKIFNDYFLAFDKLWAENSVFAFWRKIPFFKCSQETIPDIESLNLAKTREEAMEHLLLHKDKDPYSILYLDLNCTGDQIRRHYKRLAMLVHPDKNDMPQAEEAFKILQRAFDAIGEPEQRAAYDIELARQQNAQTALNQFSVLLTELQEKIAKASNTIRCTNCNGRHLRVLVDRPCYAARECAQCKIKHSAKEGDIWAETRMMGFRWVYLACMEGSIYDISQWAACQKSALAHLTANSHNVQYRIVLGDKAPKARTPVGGSTFQEFIYNLCTSSMNQQTNQETSSRRRSPRQN